MTSPPPDGRPSTRPATQADPDQRRSPSTSPSVFSEAVSGFATGDVTLGGTAGATTADRHRIVRHHLQRGRERHDRLRHGRSPPSPPGWPWTRDSNLNLASTSTDNTVTYDVTAPTVTVEQAGGQADPTNTGPIHFTVTFSEAVTGFATGDVTLTAGTAPGTLVGTVTGSGTTYDVAVSGMTGSGTVIASVAADQATDAAGNGNAGSTSADHTVTYDVTAPTVTVEQAGGQADPTNTGPIHFTVTFSEAVTGFATGDVTLTAGTAPGTLVGTVTGSGTTYDVAVSGMTGSGTVIASVAADQATDAAGNGNAGSTSADHTVTYDVTAPTVTVEQAGGQADPTNTGPIHFTVTFSEAVTGFATGDVTLTAGTAPGTLVGTVTGSGTTYDVAVSGMTGSGTVIASVAADQATDAAGNGNAGSTSADHTVTYDVTAPTVTVEQAGGQADPTNTGPIHFTVTFSEAVTGFATGDVTLTAGTAPGTLVGTVTGSGTTYDVAVSGMTGSGTVIASVAADQATDAAGNGNAGSSSSDNSVTYNAPYTLTLKVGWNLVAAAPGTAAFPNVLWGWTGSDYASTTNPVSWRGYFCKVDSGQTHEIQTVLGPHTIELVDGWNLIGNSMSSGATLTLPTGAVAWVWDADTGYESKTTLQPGQGAWVKGTSGQQVILTASGG